MKKNSAELCGSAVVIFSVKMPIFTEKTQIQTTCKLLKIKILQEYWVL